MTEGIQLTSLALPEPETSDAVTLEILARLWLPEQAFTYGERYQHPMRKLSFYASRLLLRTAFADHYQCPPQAPRFNRQDNGALTQTNTLLESNAKQQLLFSLTHTLDRVFLAVANPTDVKRLGLDTESLDRHFHAGRLVKRYFSEEVQDWFCRIKATEQQHQAFFALWTQAEAFFKATQLGLKGGIHKLEFDFDLELPTLKTKQSKLGYKAKTLDWNLLFPSVPKYAVAIAYYGKSNTEALQHSYKNILLPTLQSYSQ